MSVPRSPPLPSVSFANPTPTQPDVPSLVSETCCHVCTEQMDEKKPCMILSKCNHAFHRSCIENSLANAKECPVCLLTCELQDLRKISFPIKQNYPRQKNKMRGGSSRTYQTRNASRNLFQNSSNSLVQLNDSVEQQPTANQNIEPIPQISNEPLNSQDRPQQNSSNSNEYDFINKIIEEKLNQALQTLNITNQTGEDVVRNNLPLMNNNLVDQPTGCNIQRYPRSFQSVNCLNGTNNTQYRPSYFHLNPAITRSNEAHTRNAPENSPNSFSFNRHNNTRRIATSSSLSSNMNADKITSIIQNWSLKFDGSDSGLNVEEFLYRVTSLTNDNFEGNFEIICKNLHILLTGKARDWFWRYHKQERGNIEWNEFCNAIRSQYKDFKSSFDIREEIRNRKQRPGEKFDVFYESISAIMDRLPFAFSEMELIEILIRNLRPEIRQELLYIPVHSISHLRKLVQMRENFLEEDYVRRNFQNRNTHFPINRTNIAEIELDINENNSDPTGLSIEALTSPNSIQRCWNCDKPGHVWEDCLYERTIFCYGCGAKNTYKPQCPKCKSRTLSKNFNPQTTPMKPA